MSPNMLCANISFDSKFIYAGLLLEYYSVFARAFIALTLSHKHGVKPIHTPTT